MTSSTGHFAIDQTVTRGVAEADGVADRLGERAGDDQHHQDQRREHARRRA